MTEKKAFNFGFDLLGKALSDIFSGRVLAWQLGGTMAATLCFAIVHGLSLQTGRAAAFVLDCIGFIVAYVVLCATGCIVARVIVTSGEGKGEAGVVPLHFLIDNIGTAMLLPLVFSFGAALLAALLCAPAALWYSGVWQAILVVPSAVFFVLVFLVISDLFVLLFLVPSMVVTEQPPLVDALRRLWRLFWARKVEIAKTFGLGLMCALVAVLPVLLLVCAAFAVCGWIYAAAAPGEPFTSFAGFVLRLFKAVLLWAPICTVPLAFLNALSLNAYGELVEGLDAEEEAEAAEEEGEAPSGGEDVDLEVQGAEGQGEEEPGDN